MRYNVPVNGARSSLRVVPVDHVTTAVVVFAVSGELDLATVSAFKEAVGAQIVGAGPAIVLDLSELAFCDSTGLGSFVGLHRAAVAVGTTLSLAAPRKRIADLLQISGIDRVVTVYRSVDDAVRMP